MTPDDIFLALRALVAQSLAVDAAEVERESRLIPDLGADSLDFIDLVFLVEKRFGVKLREGELEFLAKLDLTSPDVMKEGALSAATVARLAEWLPRLRDLPAGARVAPREVFAMIEVETLCRLVERKLAAAHAAP